MADLLVPTLTSSLSSDPQEFNLSELDGITHRQRDRLRVLTLNALCSPVRNAKLETRGRLRALLHHIEMEGYDVVCLQEFNARSCIFGLSDAEHVEAYGEFREKMHSLGFHDQICGPPKQGLAAFDGGISVFSRHPFASSQMMHWVDATCWDAFAAKGILYAKIEILPEDGCKGTPMPIHILTMQAQARHAGWIDLDGIEAYRQVRLRQTQQIADAISTMCSGEAVLVLGDFNFDARDAKELALHHRVLRKATHPSDPIDVVAYTFGSHPPTFAAIDENQEPIEKFLTLSESKGNPRCLDQVYFWPAGFLETSWGRIIEVECHLQPLEIPENIRSLEALESTHVSDHYGVSVDICITEAVDSSSLTTPDSSAKQTYVTPSNVFFAREEVQSDLKNRLERWLNTVPIGGSAERSFDSSLLIRFAQKKGLWEQAPEEIYREYVEHKLKQGERALQGKSRQRCMALVIDEVETGLLMLQGADW